MLRIVDKDQPSDAELEIRAYHRENPGLPSDVLYTHYTKSYE